MVCTEWVSGWRCLLRFVSFGVDELFLSFCRCTGLEVRVPFLDKKFVADFFRIDPKLR